MVTLLDIVRLCHGGVVIGEEFDPCVVYGGYEFSEKSGLCVLRQMETELKKTLEEKLLAMKVSDFKEQSYY